MNLTIHPLEVRVMIEIHPCSPEHGPELRALTEELHMPALEGFLRCPERISIAVFQGRTVGWSYLSMPEDLLGSCFVYIYVSPSFRRRGAGRALYRHAWQKIERRQAECWSSYPPSEIADQFALSMGFDYVNTNSYMEYSGTCSDTHDGAIRPYADSDYPAAPDIWTDEYARMHTDLGLPYTPPDRTDAWRAAERAEYVQNAHLTFVMEDNGQIVGIGSLFDDNSGIGALAIDSRHGNKGYGTRLARYLTDECLRRGCKTPHLYCETNNKSAFHLYQKIGYREISQETVAIKKFSV